MIIVSTNRNVHPSKVGHEIFGNSFSGLGNRFAIAKFVASETEYVDWDEDEELHETEDSWAIDLFEAGNEADLFESLVTKINNGDSELSRPWVCFLHGNNQSFEKNLKKCRRLENLYNVNVFAFSWPSMPRTITGSLYDVVKGLISPVEAFKLVKSSDAALSNVGSSNILTGLIKNQYDDYKIARSRARDSANAFMSAVNTFHDQLISKSDTPLESSLIVHSLGNHVVESLDVAEYKAKIPNFFNNVIFHQADVDAVNYQNWISETAQALGKNHYVTINQHDWVLLISMLANKKHRLGQINYDHTTDHIYYIDFTGGLGVGTSHTMFTTSADSQAEVNQLFKLLFSSRTDITLADIGYENNTGSGLYRLVERDPDENIWGDSEDDD